VFCFVIGITPIMKYEFVLNTRKG